MIDEKTKMEVLLIDNFPVTERDKPVFLEYQELCRNYPNWIPTGLWHSWYDGKYLKTDHWMVVREIISEYWDFKCSQCDCLKEPKHVHHRDNKYRCLWKEKFNDVVYNCEFCHERHHEIWPKRNCKGVNYLKSLMYHEIKRVFDAFPVEGQAIVLGEYYADGFDSSETLLSIIKDSSYSSKGKRYLARDRVLEIMHRILDVGLGHEERNQTTFEDYLNCQNEYYKSQIDFIFRLKGESREYSRVFQDLYCQGELITK